MGAARRRSTPGARPSVLHARGCARSNVLKLAQKVHILQAVLAESARHSSSPQPAKVKAGCVFVGSMYFETYLRGCVYTASASMIRTPSKLVLHSMQGIS